MREIKFRGKTDKGKWIYGNLGTHTIILHGEISCKVIFENLEWFNTDNFPFVINDHIVDESTIGQFTGLIDKNGKEIYEGDIIHVQMFKNLADSYEESELFDIEDLKGELHADYIDKVVFEEGSFSFGSYYLDGFFGDQRFSHPIREYEVLGNIYDNPELLKEE